MKVRPDLSEVISVAMLLEQGGLYSAKVGKLFMYEDQ